MNTPDLAEKNRSFRQELHMQTRWLVMTTLIFALALSACSAGNVSLNENALSDVYTSVAITLTAQSTEPSTATQAESATATLQLVATATPAAPLIPTQTASSYSWYSANSGCEDATYIKDVTIPDGTVLSPGETFTKTWKLENTGTCVWASDFRLVFIRGDALDASDVSIEETVYPGKKAEISVDMAAPEDEGTYIGYWRLEDAYGYVFGETVTVEIVVAAATATNTPTPTATPTSTPTATVSSTATAIAATATSTATATPTSVLASPTATDAPTATPTAVPTSSPTASATLSPTSTATPDTPTPGETGG